MTKNDFSKLWEQNIKKVSAIISIYNMHLKYINNDDLAYFFAEMHNSEKVNIYKELVNFESYENKIDTYILFDFINKSSKYIKNYSIADLVSTIEKLVLKNNIEYSQLIGIYETTIGQNLEQAILALDYILKINIDISINLITPTLYALSRNSGEICLDRIMNLLTSEKNHIVANTLLALGNIKNIPINEEVSKLILEKSISNSNENVLSGLTYTLLKFYIREKDLKPQILKKLNEIVNLDPSNQIVLHSIAVELQSNGKEFDIEMIQFLLDKLENVELDSINTLRKIDHILYNISSQHFTLVIKFLERIFIQSEHKISIKNFNFFLSYYLLSEENKEDLSFLITRWFLSKEGFLCRSAGNLILEKEIVIYFDLNQLQENHDNDLYYLARKACGWYFTNPITAISLIFSTLKTCTDQEIIKKIFNLIFNPLLISYPGKVRDYIIEQRKKVAKKIKKHIDECLKNLDEYHKNLNEAYKIKELRPSQLESYTYRKYQQDLMQKRFEEPNENSLISSFSTSTLLYGNNSAFLVHTPQGSFRQTVQMQKFSHSVEFPSMEILDPLTLYNFLIHCRGEALK